LGPNGAGKSTTFRMLCGLLSPTDGMVSVADHDLRRAPAEARAHIGYMSQKFSLYGNLSVRDNLHFFSKVYGAGPEKIQWALDQFELGDHAESVSSDLSLGHKQRLAMACALMHEPEILFLDEPTSGVDPLARREFWHRINELAEQGVTVMVTTHSWKRRTTATGWLLWLPAISLHSEHLQRSRQKTVQPGFRNQPWKTHLSASS